MLPCEHVIEVSRRRKPDRIVRDHCTIDELTFAYDHIYRRVRESAREE